MKLDWATVQKAHALLVAEGCAGMLHGTAALAAVGHDIECGDIDFLCDSLPTLDGMPSEESSEPGTGIATWVNEVKVDFICDTSADRFRTKTPAVIHGIPVAAEQDVLAWKRHAWRPKDVDFLRAFPGTPEHAEATNPNRAPEEEMPF